MKMRLLTVAGGMLALLWATRAPACNVPVFRYALERWAPDNYVITVMHHGPLTAEQQAVVEAIKKTGETVANVEVELADVSRVLPQWNSLAKAWYPSVPVMRIDYPQRDPRPWAACWGPLNAGTVKQAVDSPARREVARRILKGTSAVWLVLESGDAAADGQATQRLEKALSKLEKELKLPDPDPDDPRINPSVPLAIKFSTLRISRTDPAEGVLVSMLRHIHPVVMNAKGPVVFPVFGRGRLLAGLSEENLNEEIIERAASYITGACSCEAKAQNPGIDLLVAADWDSMLEGRAVKDVELPPLIGMSQMLVPVMEDKATKPAPGDGESTVRPSNPGASPLPPPAAAKPAGTLKRNLLILAGLGVLVLLVGSIAMRRRGTP